jgi:ParB family chromosome partitioning protein
MTMIDMKKRSLGRGLSALMPSPPAPGASTTPAMVPERQRTYFAASIEQVYPSPDQPRRIFDDAELGELAASIRAHGIILPLIVRPRPQGGYLLIAGERRWRAAQRAGLQQVPVVVQDVDSREAFERALVENVQRQDLNPLEEAAAFHRLVEEFGLTQDQVAERVGKDRSTIANSLRLLRLPLSVREMVEHKTLSMGHARALLGLPSDRDMEVTARAVVARALSVRATEDLVRRFGEKKPPSKVTAPAKKSASVRDLEERLTRSLRGPVTITEDAGSKSGSIEIRYIDLDHLDRLLERLL